jgi:non-haem Fe2+, alpha-ketoglutarate-dependent halogenase
MNLLQTFHSQGYASPIPVLDADEAKQALAAFNAIEAGMAPAARSVGLLQQHLTSQAIWQISTHPRLLDAVAQVLGPDVVLLGTHFFVKYPGQTEAYVAWHQDATYWGLQPAKAVTAWLAIDRADVENGCMRVIPQSHLGGQLPHGTAERAGNLLSVNQSIEASRINEDNAADVILEPGEMSLHDGLLVHGSNPNKSNRRRAGFTVRFTSPDVRLVGNDRQKHAWKPMLVRGTDRHRNFDMLPFPFAAQLQ